MIVVAAVAAVVKVRTAAADAAVDGIKVRAAAAAIAWRCCARVKVTDAVITIGALIIMSMAGGGARSKLLLQLVVGFGLAIVVVVVVILRISRHRLRLYSCIILDCRRRDCFPLAAKFRAPKCLICE